MDAADAPGQGTVTCAAWIRRPESAHLVVLAKSGKPSSLEIFAFDSKTASLSAAPKARYEFGKGTNPVGIAVHPSGDQFVCSINTGDLKLFEVYGQEDKVKLSAKDEILLQGIVGQKKCLAFSVDGTRFASGGVDGCLRIFEWPSMRNILDEPRAHKSIQDMDFSLDSEFLASTSTDGSARIWKTSDGTPVTTLTRNSDEKIEFCRFSKDGTKPFLFCSVQRGNKPLTVVWDISTWNKIGHKRLLQKPTSIMATSLDGKYLALGSKDGDVCVVEVKKMEVRHLSKRLHLGSNISSLEFCPSERVILTTSNQWGLMATKLAVPADWKEWQIYLLLLGLFLASIVAFYIFFENSDSFWNFPLPAHHPGGGKSIFESDRVPATEPNVWGPVDL
ncbi:SEC12-like protein 1 [Andrographis paniculata]|uniref:SEC12-like protein 1 n=1 Tax=Andrographis paniculata TaxID=175694 RepID=UPI0021E8280F|nr:SEC12-like protein 1 [Andrographis paniculata]